MKKINLKHPFLLLPLCLLVLLFACQSSKQAKPAKPSIDLTDCQLSEPGVATRIEGKCGTLKVYEDRAAGTGRQIPLNIAVIPPVSRNPAPDPLVFITGGPGQAATESYIQLSSAFQRINQKRAIVLVDQRGTGKSNALKCPNLTDSTSGDPPQTSDLDQELKECLQNLNANPTLYTTSIAVEDLDQVRQALGYEQVNLYGLSYGTRVALTYLKQYPEHVRSVILDGVVPQDENLGTNVASDAERALNLIFDRCTAEAACNKAFPNIRTEFTDLLTNLNLKPVQVSVSDPSSGENVKLSLTADKVASALRLLSYSSESASLLPLLIHKAQTEGDYGLLASQYLLVSGELSDSISVGMNYSVICTEDVPFITSSNISQESSDIFLKSLKTEDLFQICKNWPKGSIPADFKKPVQSDRPVLILSGEADPVTPPENGTQAAKTLLNSLALVARGQGHNVIYRGCIPRIAYNFIENGTVKGLDTACVQDIQAMPFFVNLSGPIP